MPEPCTFPDLPMAGCVRMRTVDICNDEALPPCFGISYNTSRRIEQGAVVRASVAERQIHGISCDIKQDYRHDEQASTFG